MTTNASPLEDDLHALLRRGLPAAEGVIADRLLELPGVVARGSRRDRASRAAAFNALLRQLIGRLPGGPDSQVAASLLFGDDRRYPGGATLTARRQAAALSLGRDPDHFRKHIEPRLVAEVASQLAADSERMAARSGPPLLTPVAAPPRPVPADMFAWEALEHEEHISRLWAAVYALRAELLACERLASMDPVGHEELPGAAGAGLWRFGQLHVAIRTYRRAYGGRLLHSELAPESLIGMAGWTPPFDAADVDVVCHHAPQAVPLRTYLNDLVADPAGERVRALWRSAFLVPHITTANANGSASS